MDSTYDGCGKGQVADPFQACGMSLSGLQGTVLETGLFTRGLSPVAEYLRAVAMDKIIVASSSI